MNTSSFAISVEEIIQKRIKEEAGDIVGPIDGSTEEINNPLSIHKIQEATDSIIGQLQLGGLEGVKYSTYGFNLNEALFFVFNIIPKLEEHVTSRQGESLVDEYLL